MNKLVVILGSMLVGGIWVPAWSDPTVTLEPAVVEVALNQTFTITIRVNEVTDLYGAEVHLSYDPTVLQASRPIVGGLFPEGRRSFANTVDVNLGHIDVAQGVLENPTSGSGVLATVGFRPLQGGDTTIEVDLNPPTNRETQLVTSGAVLPFAAAGARVRITSVPSLAHAYSRGYNLVGFPLSFDDPTPSVVLQDLPEPLKLYRYQEGRYFQPQEPGFEAFAPGRGFFLRLENDTLVQVSGQPSDPTQPVTIPLVADWNMVANPFNEPLALGDIRVRTGEGSEMPLSDGLNTLTATYLWGYAPGVGYQLVHGSLPGVRRELDAWQGYWLQSMAEAELILGPPTTRGRSETASASPSSPERSGALIPLVAQVGDFRDIAFLGYSADGKLRRMHIAKPPPLSPFVRLSFDGGRAVEVHSPMEHGARWEFTVETDVVDGEISLRWPDLSAWPSDQALVLTDLESGQRQYLRTTSHYLFRATDRVRHFRLNATTRGSGIAVTNLVAGPTRGGGVSLTFTLTQAVEVEVEVQGLNGHRIRTLPRQPGVPGQNSIIWDGRDNKGRRVPNGTYLCRVLAVSEDGRQAVASRTVRIGP